MSSSPADHQAVRRKTGRPRSTRAPEAIHAAAVRLFSEHGFSGTSVRDIAAAAGVDPALVIRHFGSKEALFLAAVAVDRSVRDIVDGPLETLGRAILKRLVEDVPDDTRKLYRALFGALDRPEVRAYLETSTARQVTAPLIERLPGPDAAVRAELITVQIAGLLMNGRILGSGAGRRPDPHVLDIYARAIQALIDTPET